MPITNNFELLQSQDIPELNSRARLFRHVKTGAELLSVENDDENKVFGLTFRTPPADSTGLPHILEHSVLCGSEKYPLKEPFVELIKGSLKTFLNAFTYPDKTCYPIASQNLKDFYNLIDVYVDSVFHPLITPFTLQQEGWHYELDDPQAPLSYKGVVFNEMKGSYSSPDNVLGRYSQRSLFPDNTYGVDSGGDPREIPNLTFEQFKSFHERYYHPSNARIFFYGDDDPAERLRLMDAYLQEFDRLEVDSSIPLQPPFAAPRRQVVPYAVGEESDANKWMVTLNWLLDETRDPQAVLSLQILAYILVGTPASPLRKALIDSGLGEDLAGRGLESELRQMYFSTGMKGVVEPDVQRVEHLVVETLEKLAREGIDPATVAAAMNTVEFRLRENNTGSFPRGLLLMLRSLTTWLYDGDPLAPLAFEAPLAAIKGRLSTEPRYFENLVRQCLLENSHRTTVILQPDPDLSQREEAAEKERLEQVRISLDPEQLQAIVADTHELRLRQETPDPPEALATIPSLKLEDLDRQAKTIPLEVLQESGSTVLYHDLFTNGILYLDLGFNLHNLPQEYLPYVSLFGQAFLQMGTESQDFVRLSQRIGSRTGGIRTTEFTSAVREAEQGTAWLFLRGKAIVDQAGALLDILRDVLTTVRLDNRERFRQMVLEEKAGLEAAVVPAGHRLVNARLRAQFNPADWASEQMGGVNYLFFLRRLAEQVDQDWPAVLASLESMRRLLLSRGSLLVNVTLDAESWSRFRPRLAAFLEELTENPAGPVSWVPEPSPEFEGLTIPAQVNYVGKGADLYRLGYELDGSVKVITNYLRTTWLWERVRVQGGAYGGFCQFDHHSGVFTFFSYRDPNLLATLKNFDASGKFLRRLDLSQAELTKTIIGAIGELDAYQLPDAKGFTSMVRYLTGDSDEKRQRRREQVLDTTPADFHAFGELLERVKDAGRVVVLGSHQSITQANETRPGWLEVKKVL